MPEIIDPVEQLRLESQARDLAGRMVIDFHPALAAVEAVEYLFSHDGIRYDGIRLAGAGPTSCLWLGIYHRRGDVDQYEVPLPHATYRTRLALERGLLDLGDVADFRHPHHVTDTGRPFGQTPPGSQPIEDFETSDADDHHAECSSRQGTGYCDCRGLPFLLPPAPEPTRGRGQAGSRAANRYTAGVGIFAKARNAAGFAGPLGKAIAGTPALWFATAAALLLFGRDRGAMVLAAVGVLVMLPHVAAEIRRRW